MTLPEPRQLHERRTPADNVSRQLRPVQPRRFIYTSHRLWEPLSWHVRKPQTVTSQWIRRMVQCAAQTAGRPLSTCEVVGILMTKDMWVHRAKNNRPIFRICYCTSDLSCARSVAITCKSSLNIQLEWEVDGGARDNRNNEQKQGHHLKDSVANCHVRLQYMQYIIRWLSYIDYLHFKNIRICLFHYTSYQFRRCLTLIIIYCQWIHLSLILRC